MDTSLLYHALGMKNLHCSATYYKGTTIYLNVEYKKPQKCCPHCHSRNIVRNGYRYRDFLCVPWGHKRVVAHMKLYRYRCKDCGYDRQEEIKFAKGSCGYTRSFARYVLDLLRIGTIKDVAALLGVSWDTVKSIHKNYLKNKYSSPSLKGVTTIGIDEFAVRKGHVYKTIVVDLDTGRILYAGDGKGAGALDGFWRRVKWAGIKIEYVSTDLSSAFMGSVMANAPDATLVFDHFHVIKLMNDALDDIRRCCYAMEKDLNKRKVIKGTRYLLLANGTDIFDGRFRTRLDNVLEMNKPLNEAYTLKESLREIWAQPTKDMAQQELEHWIEMAEKSQTKQLKRIANTLKAVRFGILAWYDCHISTAKIEGINNKIKVMKRNAYGFRDDEYFRLRLFSLHDCCITRNVG